MVCANTMIICIHNNIAYFPIIFLRTNVHFVVINENISYQKRKFNHGPTQTSSVFSGKNY